MTALPTTTGSLLNGRVSYEQPVAGYRTGIEPVFLAAAVPARPGDRVLEGGTGAGAALLCLAARVPGLVALGVERDPAMAVIARRNAKAVPGLTFHAGAIETLDENGLFDHACANPPWHDPAGTPPADQRRRDALHAPGPDTLAAWCRALSRYLRPGGTLTLVLASHLAVAGSAALQDAGCGRLRTRPLLPKQGREPRITLLHGAKATPEAAVTLPPLVLHGDAGGYTPAADAILRDGAALTWDG